MFLLESYYTVDTYKQVINFNFKNNHKDYGVDYGSYKEQHIYENSLTDGSKDKRIKYFGNVTSKVRSIILNTYIEYFIGNNKYDTIHNILEDSSKIKLSCISTVNSLQHISKQKPGNNMVVFNTLTVDSVPFLIYLSSIFEKVYLIGLDFIVCKKYSGKCLFSDKDISSAINNSLYLTVNIDRKVRDLVDYINCNIKYNERIYKTLLEFENSSNKNSFERILDMVFKNAVEDILKICSSFRDVGKLFSLLKRVYIENKIIKIHSGVGKNEGVYLYNFTMKFNKPRVMEVGMANGISSFFICSALKKNGGNLVSIDPYQTTKWNSMGMKLLKEYDLHNYQTLIEKKSYSALPYLLDKRKKFDIIFIDGWHTFDYTLVDFFYGDLLLEIGGYIIIDDVLHHGVDKSVKYINKNYRHFEKVKGPSTFAVYKKLEEDKRDWNFHKNF